MHNFFSLKYWFDLRPEALANTGQRYFLSFIIVLLGLTITSGILKAKQKSLYNKIWKKFNSFFLTNFIISLLLLFFTYEMVPFLSARFWFLLWGLSILVWIFFIGKEFIKIPKIKQEIEKEKEYKKYIP